MAGCNVSELIDKFDTLNGYMMTLVSRFVTPEGENIAEVTEGQTLSAVCSPDVNIDVSCGSSGCGGGCDNPPSQPGVEGETPPEGWIDPPEVSPEFDRKCRVANMTHEGIRQVIYQFYRNDLGDIITTLGLGTAVGVVMAVLTIITGPIGLTIAVAGVVTGICLAFVGQSVDLDELLGILDTNAQDLVCALYSSLDAQAAVDDFVSVLESGGANPAQTNLIRAIFIIDAANALFFSPDNSSGDKLEADLDGYSPTIDCSLCSTPGLFDFTIDDHGWLIDETDSTNGVYSAGLYFQGTKTGVADAKLGIYYPDSKATIDTLTATVYGKANGVTRIQVYTSDDLATWASAGYKDNVPTAGFTEIEFTGLGIVDKYIKLFIKRFQTNSLVQCQSIEWS